MAADFFSLSGGDVVEERRCCGKTFRRAGKTFCRVVGDGWVIWDCAGSIIDGDFVFVSGKHFCWDRRCSGKKCSRKGVVGRSFFGKSDESRIIFDARSFGGRRKDGVGSFFVGVRVFDEVGGVLRVEIFVDGRYDGAGIFDREVEFGKRDVLDEVGDFLRGKSLDGENFYIFGGANVYFYFVGVGIEFIVVGDVGRRLFDGGKDAGI